MNGHKVTLYIIDHDEIGAEKVNSVLENARYPNRCVLPRVRDIETVDIGEWEDSHPLNYKGADFVAYFKEKTE